MVVLDWFNINWFDRFCHFLLPLFPLFLDLLDPTIALTRVVLYIATAWTLNHKEAFQYLSTDYVVGDVCAYYKHPDDDGYYGLGYQTRVRCVRVCLWMWNVTCVVWRMCMLSYVHSMCVSYVHSMCVSYVHSMCVSYVHRCACVCTCGTLHADCTWFSVLRTQK